MAKTQSFSIKHTKDFLMHILSVIVSLLTLVVPFTVQAQTLSRDRTTEIVIPFAPGGAASNTGQMAAKFLKDAGYNAIATNKPGNNSIIANNSVAKAEANGHTLLIGTTSGLSANLAFRSQQTGMEYNENSFAPIVLLNQSGFGLITAGDSVIKNYELLKFYVRANPDKFNSGTFNLTYGALFKEWARREGLPEPTIVPYKGSASMVADVAGGTLLAAFDNFGHGAPMLPLLQSNRLRLIATFDNTATKEIKKIAYPVTDISKLHPELKFSVWLGLWAPAGTPVATINEINRVINTALTDPRNRDLLEHTDGIGGTPTMLENLFRRDLRTLSKLAK
jgi:tripartite-type tricarboxylate transporter receptor subunit TctC